jgi:hypothetical protein
MCNGSFREYTKCGHRLEKSREIGNETKKLGSCQTGLDLKKMIINDLCLDCKLHQDRKSVDLPVVQCERQQKKVSPPQYKGCITTYFKAVTFGEMDAERKAVVEEVDGGFCSVQ